MMSATGLKNDMSRRNSYQAGPAGRAGKAPCQSLPSTVYHASGARKSRGAHRPPKPGEVTHEYVSVCDGAGHALGGIILYAHDGQRVFRSGILFDDGCYERKLKASHLLHTPPAIALQQPIVEELAQRGCREIRVMVSDDGARYVVDFATFLRDGRALDRGFGPQVMLPLNRWQKAGTVQGSLFEEVG